MRINSLKTVLLCKISHGFRDCGYFASCKSLALGIDYIRLHCLNNPIIKKHFDIQAEYFDANNPLMNVITVIEANNPDIVGFSCYSDEYETTIKVAERFRERNPSAVIVLGGPQFFSAAEQLEKHSFADIVVEGEGELPFEDYLLSVVDGRDTASVPGLAVRKNGEIVFTGPEKKEIDPAVIPSLVDDEYLDSLSEVAIYQTSRGCAHRCAYCSTAGQKYRELPLERVQLELLAILKNPNITKLLFADFDLTGNVLRFGKILDFLAIHNTRKILIDGFWSSTPKIVACLKTMRKAGFIRQIRISAQTACKEALTLSHRQWLTPAHISKTAPDILKYFPDARIDLLLGLPGETANSFRQGLLEFFRLGFRAFFFHNLMISPGSELYKRREHLGLEYRDDFTYEVVRTPHLSEREIYHAKRFAIKFQALAWLLQPEDIPFFESHGIDILEIAEHFDLLEKIDKPNSDSNINNTGPSFEDVPANMVDQLADFIEKRFQIDPSDAKRMREYIRVKYELYAFERQVQYSLIENPLIASFPLVCSYAKIETNSGVLGLLGLEQRNENSGGGDDKTIVFAVFSSVCGKVVPVTSKSDRFFEKLLRALNNAKNTEEILNSFQPSQRATVVKSIATLGKLGII